MEKFDGTEGENISLEEAIAMTKAFREANPRAIKAHYIGKNIMMELLEQRDCVGMRVYNGINEDGTAAIVIVGVTEDNKDLYLTTRADKAIPCPESCDIESPLVKDGE